MISKERRAEVDEIQGKYEDQEYLVVRHPPSKKRELILEEFHLLLIGRGEVVGVKVVPRPTVDNIHCLQQVRPDIPNFKKVLCYKRGSRWAEAVIG